MKELPNLTPLRFFLALLVVLFHVPQFCENRGFPFVKDLSILNRGTEAVYMFFSLSGFLIIKQLYVEKSLTGTINLKKFYLRRAFRIFPLYFVVLLIGLVYYNYILPKMGFDFQSNYALWKGILLSVFFLPNIFTTLYSPGGIIEVLWSIGIEEQFYLLIAPLLAFINKSKIVAFLLTFTVLYFTLFFSGLMPELSQFAMLFFYFTFSGLIAILSDKINLNTPVKIALLLTTIAYFSTLLFSFSNTILFHLFSMVLFGFFLLSISQKPVFTIKNTFLLYLGKISYGIYMFHAIVMQLVGLLYLKIKIDLDYYPKFFLFLFLVIAITILVSAISYKYFETYFIKKKLNYKSL